MPFGIEINTETSIGLWSICGRWIFAAIYTILIVTFLILALRRKVNKKVGIIVISISAILFSLMFVGGMKKSVFTPDNIAQFCSNIEKKLSVEYLDLEESTDDSLVWKWSETNEDFWYMISVRENTPEYYVLDQNGTIPKMVHGKINGCKYTFNPMFPQIYEEYLYLKTNYTGKLYIQNDKYYIEITYTLFEDDFIDYVSVIYPFLYNKEHSLSYLIETSDSEQLVLSSVINN